MKRLALAALALAATTSAHAAVIVSTGATMNENCSAGVCTPTAKDAVLNASDLANMLATSDVVVKTDAKAKNILINAAFSWVSTHRLTLDAWQSIKVQQVITVAGPGSLTLTTNDGGTGGDYSFVLPGRVTFWDTGSSLVINGASYTLVGDIKTLAGDIAANPSGNFALTANHDALADGVYPNAPIAHFNGSFEGLGNTISNLAINSTIPDSWVGLFASLTSPGVLRDINLSNANVSGVGTTRNYVDEYVGSLAAYSLQGTIIAANVSGIVSGGRRASVGGLLGLNNGKVLRSTSSANINASRKAFNVGGLVGQNSGPIVSSHSSGDVHGGRYTGGLAGYNYNGPITGSYSSAAVKGSLTVGGLVGVNGDLQAGDGVIEQSYATGPVAAGQQARMGGLVGDDDAGVVSQSYATGAVPAGTYAGGLIGVSYYTQADHAYWDMTTTGQNEGTGEGNLDGITGLTDTQLKSGLPAGFDPAVWAQDPNINNGWPYLIANPPQ